MKIKLLEKTDTKVKFELAETNPAFTNMLRRTIVQHVSVAAIDNIDVIKNTSALYNETIAHRIGHIPISYKNEMVQKENCKCKGKGCSFCEVKMVLQKSGPCTVYAKDFKSTDKDVKPSTGDIIIAKLYENQDLNLEATVVINTGKEHSNWQAAIVGYQYYPELKIAKDVKNIKDIIAACPKGLIDEKTMKLTTPEKCDFCQQCVEVASKGAVTITGDKTRHILTVETVSGTDPKTIILDALTNMAKNLKELETQIK